MSDPFRLDGKRILITGASSGIGRAIAIAVSQMGGIVLANGRNPDRLKSVVDDLVPNSEHRAIVGDLRDQHNVAEIAAVSGSVDGIVHGAGIVGVSPVRVVTREFMLDRFESNYFGPMMLTKGMLAKNQVRPEGSIVFLASIAAHTGTRGVSVYSATKASLIVTTKCLALEVSKHRIRVNCLSPGLVRTPIFKPEEQEWLNEEEKRYALGLGEPEDVAHAAVFLLAPASRWMTGQTIIMDGACEWI